ncbi:hypothetical protein BsIDN1_00780 [Bacillus safensis]|uniref:AbrB C-terminal domain-containing protein n=1 Tax=Bacillus safensis TaxID=561879 RepID=A0A5S9LYH4_BACIA|nr:hypothetical protein BsIDN1_00780 [Bacillus safensis]
MEIYVDDEKIILKKYKPNMTCQVTGEVSDDNLKLANGKLVLSREGAEQKSLTKSKTNFNHKNKVHIKKGSCTVCKNLSLLFNMIGIVYRALWHTTFDSCTFNGFLRR